MKLVAVTILFTAAVAQSVLAAESKPNTSVFGAWTVDTSRLSMAPAARPKSVTITFADAGAERLKARVEVVDPAGNRLEAEGVTPLDGAPTPVKSNFEADVSATTMPRPHCSTGGRPCCSSIRPAPISACRPARSARRRRPG